MCFNKEVSFISYIGILAISIYLWNRNRLNDKVIAIILFVYAQMQLAEMFIWIGQNNPTFNYIGSYFGFFILIFEPLGNALALYANKYVSRNVIHLLSTINLLFFLYLFIFYQPTDSELQTKPGVDGHLVYDFFSQIGMDNQFIWMILFFLPGLFIKPVNSAIIYTSYGIGSLLLSIYLYNNQAGSIWCFLVILLGFLAIFLN